MLFSVTSLLAIVVRGIVEIGTLQLVLETTHEAISALRIVLVVSLRRWPLWNSDRASS